MNTVQLFELLYPLEIEWQQAHTRQNPERMAQLLHRDFFECSRSGRGINRPTLLRPWPSSDTREPLQAQDFAVEKLAKNFAMLRYRSFRPGRNTRPEQHANRSSLWQHTGTGWQLRFHQAAPTHAFALTLCAPDDRHSRRTALQSS